MQIKSLNVGMPQTIKTENNEFVSAIRKVPTSQKIMLTKMGFEGDGCYEPVHGGVHKAVHMFCFDNYAFFEERAQSSLPIPTFGENITICGYDECEARVGDTLQMGDAIVQISEPTIRCNTIGRSAGYPLMLKWIHEQYKTGFYLRVLQEGNICVDSSITMLDRGSEEATIDKLNRAMFCHMDNMEIVKPLLEITGLSDGWKENLKKRAKIK
ncbi:MOSC domain-containing protein [Candidatus Uabimicrobium amorphum]|uniref:MOSC domain-containing protein n=1 Tax=Uabimicrobium amorphum TaxID=2596890 RepID=A0A5S9IPV5_UABAM|nr:MOSC domain-containing protein [Candidatus Uabimicrobium amorphum]BBM85888.1 MOSC domain-containing protein [Candidatus Uabimicrobium amorphum]